MRVLVVSDTHGRHTTLDQILLEAGDIDMFVHLGDVEDGDVYINVVVECEKHIVGGNNDYFSHLPREEEFYIGTHKVYITHGHQYSVSYETESIKKAGLARNAEIVMFGHTHKPFLEVGEKITLLNPGSVSYPRQKGRQASYLILEMNEKGDISYQQHYLGSKKE